jgi:hypothetical protein
LNELIQNNNSNISNNSNINKPKDAGQKEVGKGELFSMMDDQELNEFNKILDDIIASHLLDDVNEDVQPSPVSSQSNLVEDNFLVNKVFGLQNMSNNVEIEFIDNSVFLQNSDPMMIF